MEDRIDRRDIVIDKINMVIGKEIEKIMERIDYYKDGIMEMETLDKIFERYCENSMFDGSLSEIFQNKYCEEGSYSYFVSEDSINEILDEEIDYDLVDFEQRAILVEYMLINEVEEYENYDYYEYSKWIIKVINVEQLWG